MLDRLNREIILHIFQHLGIAKTKQFGSVGLTIPALKINNLSVELESNNVRTRHPVYAGQVNPPEGGCFKALVVDLTLENEPWEFLVVFRNQEMPTFGIQLIMNDDDNGRFEILHPDPKIWIKVNNYQKCMSLAGFEMITSSGSFWNPLDETEALYNAALSFLQEGEKEDGG